MNPVRPIDPIVGRTASSAYVPALDAFRALAILSVMCLHWLPATCLLNRLQGQTSNGVHLFFVLSGFLITRILLQSRTAIELRTTGLGWALRQFYARRFVRIFPLYYLALAVGAALAFPGLRTAFAWHAAYLSNVYYFLRHGAFDGPASVFWTLAVEEQFYLIWPLVILLVPRRGLLPTIATIAVLGTATRVAAIFRDPSLEILTPACANFLAMGALVATADDPTFGSFRSGRNLRRVFAFVTIALVTAGVSLAVLAGPSYLTRAPAVRAIDQTIASMAYAVLFARAARGFPRWVAVPLRRPPLLYLGRISYGLYVYHLFVAATLERAGHSRWTAHLTQPLGPSLAASLAGSFAVKFAVTVVIASASWFLFERPLNELKRYLPYARPRLTGSAASSMRLRTPGRQQAETG